MILQAVEGGGLAATTAVVVDLEKLRSKGWHTVLTWLTVIAVIGVSILLGSLAPEEQVPPRPSISVPTFTMPTLPPPIQPPIDTPARIVVWMPRTEDILFVELIADPGRSTTLRIRRLGETVFDSVSDRLRDRDERPVALRLPRSPADVERLETVTLAPVPEELLLLVTPRRGGMVEVRLLSFDGSTPVAEIATSLQDGPIRIIDDTIMIGDRSIAWERSTDRLRVS